MYYKLRCNSTQFVIYYKLCNYYKLQRNIAWLQGTQHKRKLQQERYLPSLGLFLVTFWWAQLRTIHNTSGDACWSVWIKVYS